LIFGFSGVTKYTIEFSENILRGFFIAKIVYLRFDF